MKKQFTRGHIKMSREICHPDPSPAKVLRAEACSVHVRAHPDVVPSWTAGENDGDRGSNRSENLEGNGRREGLNADSPFDDVHENRERFGLHLADAVEVA